MSDDTPPPPRPPEPPRKPTTKTSTVPLKKETVRITLRAKPGEGVVAPSDETQAAPPPPATATGTPPPPPAGGMHKTQKVSVTAAGAADATAGAAGAAAGAVGAAAAGTAAAAAAVGAPTVKLDRAPAAPATPGATQQLPRATVQLQRTQPLGTAPGASGPAASQQLQGSTTTQLRAAKANEPSKMLLPFSILCGLLSLGVLAIALLATDKPFPGKAKTYGFLVPADSPYNAKIPPVVIDEAPPEGEPVGLEGIEDAPAPTPDADAAEDAADAVEEAGGDAAAGGADPAPAL